MWFRNAGVLWIIIGAVQIYYQFSERGRPGFPFWFLLGVGCLAYYWLSATKFIVFNTPRGRLFVIADRKQSMILSEIQSRRASQLKRRYAKIIDPRDPAREAARLNWLCQQKIITQEEFDSLMVDLRLGLADTIAKEEQSNQQE